ncbi:MAG: hypothetical protein R2883_05035 [Caldisericia bacterium]
MISFVAADNLFKVPPVAVTNKEGFWSQTGFAEDIEYYVYPSTSGATFTDIPNRSKVLQQAQIS